MHNIEGINKTKLLKAAWKKSSPASFFTVNKITPPEFIAPPLEILNYYIDYYCGRCIKMDLSKNTCTSTSYDKDMGEGTFAEIVASFH